MLVAKFLQNAFAQKRDPIALRQVLQTLRWFRQDIGIEGPTTEG